MQVRAAPGALAIAGLAAAVAGVLAACGDDEAPAAGAAPTAGCAVAEGGRATVVAEDLAWDVDCLEVRAGEPVTIVVDNRDVGVNHNLHLPDAPGRPTTELEAGPVVQELEVELPAGRYRYLCDIHPTMVGELRAVEQSGSTGPSPEGPP